MACARRHLALVVLACVLTAGNGDAGRGEAFLFHSSEVLRLATTTSTADSGLLDAILPDFERRCGCRVDVVAVGTGQAVAIGRRGDADVLLVHARPLEERFVAEGHGGPRLPVMSNDFVLVGPVDDPARVAGVQRAAEAFGRIAARAAAFASRGDGSGTHLAEQEIWRSAAVSPRGPWFRSLGQGMGETLTLANELPAYCLADRGTWLSMRARLPSLRLLVGGAGPAENRDPALRNEYSVIVVSGSAHPGVSEDLARRFATWLRSPDTQEAIATFGVARYGQALFHPAVRREP